LPQIERSAQGYHHELGKRWRGLLEEIVGEAYLKRLMSKTLEGEKEWPFGFFTVLFYVAESWDISI